MGFAGRNLAVKWLFPGRRSLHERHWSVNVGHMTSQHLTGSWRHAPDLADDVICGVGVERHGDDFSVAVEYDVIVIFVVDVVVVAKCDVIPVELRAFFLSLLGARHLRCVLLSPLGSTVLKPYLYKLHI